MTKTNRAVIAILWLALIALIALFGDYYTAERQFDLSMNCGGIGYYFKVTDKTTGQEVPLSGLQVNKLWQCMDKTLHSRGFAFGRAAETEKNTYEIVFTSDALTSTELTVSSAKGEPNILCAPLGDVALSGGGTVADLIADMAAGRNDGSGDETYGEAFRALNDPELKKQTAATYKDYTVTMADISYNQKTDENSYTVESDFDIAKRLITNDILRDEAERKGLTATDAEIENSIDGVRESYAIPEGKAEVDKYLAATGQTFDEYLDTLRAMFPAMLERQKLKEWFGRDWCGKNGLEYKQGKSWNNSELTMAWEIYCDRLYSAHSGEIIYYVRRS